MKRFELTETESLRQIIREGPLGTIVSLGSDGLGAHHIPMHLRGDVLVGHMGRNNALAQRHGTDVIAIFRAADSYVSPAWYPGKAEHGRVVPTWNYVVAHAHGRLRVIDDAEWIRAQVEALTDQQEAGSPHPWRVSDAPAEYIDKMLHAIVGFEIPIDRLEGVRKASQNREERDRVAVKEGLLSRGGAAACGMARWM